MPPIPNYILDAFDRLMRRGPISRAARELAKRLEAEKRSDIEPKPGESLATWFNRADGGAPGGRRLRLVVGESRGAGRGGREDWEAGKMIRAASSDGAAGSELLLGLLSGPGVVPAGLDYRFLVDEWPETADQVEGSDLLVIGTDEVNVVAAFVSSLLAVDVVQVRGLADSLVYFTDMQPAQVARASAAGDPVHPGALLLLKNPWDLQRRVLWVAGLTGRATADGARLVRSFAGGNRGLAQGCVGVIYRADRDRGNPPIPVACRRLTGAGCYDWEPC